MNIEKIIEKAKVAAERLAASNRTLEKRKELLGRKLDLLTFVIFPAIQKAAEKYNETVSYKIVTQDLKLSFNLETSKVVLSVRLRTSSGHEPDEEFSFKDEKDLNEALGPIVDKELAAAGVPLTFMKAQVPTDYFSI